MNANSNNEIYELSGQVESVVYRNDNNGYTVIELAGENEMITAVGIMPMVNVANTLSSTEHIKTIHHTDSSFQPRRVSAVCPKILTEYSNI